jgi:gamma-glutamyltranspeptidase
MPDKLVLEKTGFDEGLARTLEARGHALEWRERGFGALNAVEIAGATRMLTGVGDARRTALALGLERAPTGKN